MLIDYICSMHENTNNPSFPIEELITFRHHLHSKAELSGEEKYTSEAILSQIKKYKPDQLITGIGGYGLAAIYKGEQDGRRLLFRADMDALPIEEINEVAYKSQNIAVSHTCGHDGHSTILIGLAALLNQNPPKKGEVVLLFQPAEETGMGANQVIADEKFEQIKPDFAFALHNLPGFEKGQIIWRNGTFAAASVGLQLELTGRTAHASQPETGLSPATAMAEIIHAFQALNVTGPDEDNFAGLTITHAQLGERAVGTAPGRALIWATLRSYQDDLLEELQNNCIAIAHDRAQNNKLKIMVDWQEPFAASVNAVELNDHLLQAVRELNYPLEEKKTPFRWSEDFGHFGSESKTCLFGLGAGRDQPALHNPDYDFPDGIILPGAQLFDAIRKQITG